MLFNQTNSRPNFFKKKKNPPPPPPRGITMQVAIYKNIVKIRPFNSSTELEFLNF